MMLHMRFTRQIFDNQQVLLNSSVENTFTETITTPIISLLNNETNSISSFSSNKLGLPWNLNFIVLLVLAFALVIFIAGISIYYWYSRKRSLCQQHSATIPNDRDFLESIKIQDAEFSSNSVINQIKRPPPIPPRPTAYKTTLGKIEYRSNL